MLPNKINLTPQQAAFPFLGSLNSSLTILSIQCTKPKLGEYAQETSALALGLKVFQQNNPEGNSLVLDLQVELILKKA